MKQPALFRDLRADFPILESPAHHKPLIYLDSAATTQKPQIVLDTLAHFYAHEYGTVHRAIYHLASQATERYHQVREKVAHFLNAPSSEQIVFTKGTTDGINLVAHSYGSLLQEGDEILISEMEHHSNLVPWQLLAQRKHLTLRFIPITDRLELDLAAFRKLLSPKTKLVSIAHVSNAVGTIHPIETIIQEAHAIGAKVLIDAAQSVAHLPIDVQALDVDFLAFSGHKMYGPTGIGILYGKQELLAAMPPLQGGGDMIERVTLEKTSYQAPPLRFEAGTPPIAEVMGLGAAIDYLTALDLTEVHEYEQALLHYAKERLSSIPHLHLIGAPAAQSAILSFIIDGVHPLDCATLLDLEGIAIRSGHHCCQPLMDRLGLPGTCRISFAPFNTFEEIDALIDALKKCLAVLLP